MKKLIDHLLYVPKHAKASDENISKLIMPSMIGILLCAVCLAGLTWAWFYASVNTQSQTITAANFYVEVDVTAESGHISNNFLEHNTQYTFTLTRKGTSSAIGYCEIKIGNEVYYTESIPTDSPFKFTFIPAADCTYTVTPIWGISPPEGAVIIQNNGSFGSESQQTPPDLSNPAETNADNQQTENSYSSAESEPEIQDASDDESLKDQTGEALEEGQQSQQTENMPQETINETGQEAPGSSDL